MNGLVGYAIGVAVGAFVWERVGETVKTWFAGVKDAVSKKFGKK